MLKSWKEFAKKVGDFQISLVFKIFYFLIITPVGIIVSKFSDPLKLNGFPRWGEIEKLDENIKEMRGQ